MCGYRVGCCVVVFSFLISSPFLSIAEAQNYQGYPSSANVSSSWANSVGHWAMPPNWLTVKPILVRETSGPGFLCGFYCDYNSNSCLFAVLIYQHEEYPQLVWSANRNNPVKLNATLELTGEGDLILQDSDGSLVWSTNTSGKKVSGLKLTEYGDLVLFNTEENSAVWESFDHPTDSLVVGQWLHSGMKLRASISDSNWTEGLFVIVPTPYGFAAQIESNPPELYSEVKNDFYNMFLYYISKTAIMSYHNSSLYYAYADEYGNLVTSIPEAVSAQYMKLGADGHLRVYQWQESTFTWNEADDLLKGNIDEHCGYPLVCGRYGICSKGQCYCPPPLPNGTSYFKPTNEKQPNLGCSVFLPISCHFSRYHTLLELQDTDYFFFWPDIRNINIQMCKQACLKNCSCKAAVFKYNSSTSVGDCCLLSEVFSLKSMDGTSNYNTSLFLKVQNKTEDVGNKIGRRTEHTRTLFGTSLGAVLGVVFCICVAIMLLWKRRDSLEVEEDYLNWVQGMPTRFSYHELKVSTKNFSCKLGEGGFGQVFEGILSNGMKVAVKRLESLGQVKKSFLAEVETIGNIHHVNLVRLVGFCAEKSHRLLVYEYMCNGPLDRWIFHINKDLTLCWQTRKKIILDIAKGLAYLHEDCRQKIFHLDIKPQNILLDENLRAKVSDFGLSKLIDKDQSQVVTIMRGTPGYLAPEWLSSVITEKVDVYSFGVVVLEILCGRRNIDRSQPEEDMHLLSILKRKAEEEQFADIIDQESEDMQEHGEEVVEMMRLAAWCLQCDYSKRPSMSVVVKVLEGSVGVEVELDYSFSYSPLPGKSLAQGYKAASATAPVLPSTLSGPR